MVREIISDGFFLTKKLLKFSDVLHIILNIYFKIKGRGIQVNCATANELNQ